jgi:hypothetical protein
MLLRTALAVAVVPTLLACGYEPSPVVVGRVGPALTSDGYVVAPAVGASIDVEINGDDRFVPLGVEETFAIQTLPTGDIEVRAAIEGIAGTMEVYDVQPGEVIEVGVEAAPGSLLMSVVRRDSPGADYGIIYEHGPLQIHSNHVVHHLEPGIYEGDIIITGDHVTIVGPDYYGCRRGGRAILLGDLIIEGDHVRVVNLEVEGQTLVFGAHNRIYQSCELFGWDDDRDSD